MNLRLPTESVFIPETDDSYLQLFPYRWDYIYSPNGLAKPEWRTETRHPLGDRILQESYYLYGVRFGYRTRYCMLDIDATSIYHPNRDPLAIQRIIGTLEPLGLVQHVAVSSSYSGGLHLYFPFELEANTWEIATTVTTLLQNAGFQLRGGTLETFPNVKTSATAKYAAHRLPMQHGSYLLDAEWEAVGLWQHQFVTQWHHAAGKNVIDQAAIDKVLKLRRYDYRITKQARKFLQDLDAEIEPGWTAHGQTNRILGRIALRGYCFGHITEGDQVLTGDRLVRYICQTARALPGFTEWCRHIPELERKAKFWARSTEASPRYFPYAIGKVGSLSEDDRGDREVGGGNAWNVLQLQLARIRIRDAIADCLNSSVGLLSGIRERLDQLRSKGISTDTLYRHMDLWHPEHLTDSEPSTPHESEIDRISLLVPTGWINRWERGYSRSLAKILYKQGGSRLSEAIVGFSPGEKPSVPLP